MQYITSTINWVLQGKRVYPKRRGTCLGRIGKFAANSRGYSKSNSYDQLWAVSPTSSGWWFQPFWKTLVSWDYYSQYIEKHMFQTTNQPTHHGKLIEAQVWKYGYCQPADFGCESTNRGDIQQQGGCLCFDIFLDDNEIGNLHQKSLSSILKHGALAVSISVSEADICSGWHSFFNGIPGEGSGRLLVRDSRWQQEVTSLGPQEHILTYLKNLTQTQNYGWFGVKDYGKVTLSLNRHPQEAGHTLMTNSLVSS